MPDPGIGSSSLLTPLANSSSFDDSGLSADRRMFTKHRMSCTIIQSGCVPKWRPVDRQNPFSFFRGIARCQFATDIHIADVCSPHYVVNGGRNVRNPSSHFCFLRPFAAQGWSFSTIRLPLGMKETVNVPVFVRRVGPNAVQRMSIHGRGRGL